MTKIILASLLFSIAFSQQHTLTILHWNDFHSQNLPYQVKAALKERNTDTTYLVGGSAVLASYIKKNYDSDSTTLLLCAGDDFQGSPVSTITKGSSQIKLLNLLTPDAFALGNHEFDYGKESLKENIKKAHFPVLAANLFDGETDTTFAAPFILKQIGKIKVAIVGLITTDLSTLALPENIKSVQVKPASESMNALVPALKRIGADLIIAVTHEGVKEDSILAARSPDIDVIIGGHSHTPLFTPKHVNGILIAQAGSRGRWLGKVELTVDTDKDTVLQSSGELIECRASGINPDTTVAKVVGELEQLADKSLNEIVAELKTDWVRNGTGESNIGNWISDAMRNYAKTDIAFQNSGGIRKDVLAGTLTVRDFWEISPFGNTLLTFKVSGETLQSMLSYQVSASDELCQVSGLTIEYVVKEGKRILKKIMVGNEPLNAKKMYSVVTNNFVESQSKKYFGVEIPPSAIKQLHAADRDVLIEAARKQNSIASTLEGRIKEQQ